jgi:hypothetical protein
MRLQLVKINKVLNDLIDKFIILMPQKGSTILCIKWQLQEQVMKVLLQAFVLQNEPSSYLRRYC